MLKSIRFSIQSIIISATLVVACHNCFAEVTNPDDPYEASNRRIYKFNQAFDATFIQPPTRLYKFVLPGAMRSGINNFFNNINMIPTVANDLLQAEWQLALKDSWRFMMNSTLGIGGLFDPAERASLPPHSNDLGITFAKWGDRHSPYFIIPFLGPSTFRDGMGLMFNYFLTPYPYLDPVVIYPLIGLRYIDLRSQMFETERLMIDALDKYTFMRDAYLQHRNYLITGEEENKAPFQAKVEAKQQEGSSLYVDDTEVGTTPLPNIPMEPENGTPSEFPLTTAQNASHRAPSA